mmetsp:Transcript_72347/g.200665  ORF Transcript_72347/g.200665 Transcript_72347/m.200665 type:complete len:473 (-) Transcript_72347:92-1510(-)
MKFLAAIFLGSRLLGAGAVADAHGFLRRGVMEHASQNMSMAEKELVTADPQHSPLTSSAAGEESPAKDSAPSPSARDKESPVSAQDAAIAAAKKGPTPGTPQDPQFRTTVLVVLGILVVCLLATVFVSYNSHFTKEPEEHNEYVEKRKNRNMDEDVYGMAIASLVRDNWMLSNKKGSFRLRSIRISLSLSLVAMSFVIQLYVMWEIKKFCSAKWVHDIREDYNEYELHMYGSEADHTWITANGKHRGFPRFFQPSNFLTLDSDLKERVCNIPFSQPSFFLAVLYIWTLTCVSEIRKCASLFISLVVKMATLPDMTSAMSEAKDDFPDREHELVIDGLTRCIKAIITGCVLVPRLVITFTLLWLGSRFLAATNDFSELVLNAVALEFLLAIKDLLYMTVVPERNKRETASVEIHPSAKSEPATNWSYLGTFSWGFLSMVWVCYYMYLFQSVLPGYNWDVNTLCTPWLAERYKV